MHPPGKLNNTHPTQKILAHYRLYWNTSIILNDGETSALSLLCVRNMHIFLNLFVKYEFKDRRNSIQEPGKRMPSEEYMAPIAHSHTLSPRRRRCRWQRHHHRFSAKTNLISSARSYTAHN